MDSKSTWLLTSVTVVTFYSLINARIAVVCGIQGGWGSPVNTCSYRDPWAALKKLKPLGPLQNCGLYPYQGLVKISGWWRNGKHLNMRSGHDFVAGYNCGGMPGHKKGWVILLLRAEGIKKPPLTWELCWLRRPLSKFLTWAFKGTLSQLDPHFSKHREEKNVSLSKKHPGLEINEDRNKRFHSYQGPLLTSVLTDL